MIDLRSDTVTKPSSAMRTAMAAAEVGDDVYGDDPTVNRLQERAAEIFEKEAALWVPTGCMANEIAVKVHTKAGQEIIIEEQGHIHEHELAAAAVISGVLVRTVRSNDGSGHLTWEEIEPALRINRAYWVSTTGLICLENTHNFAGGTVMSAEHCADICRRAREIGLPVHMDGARIFNAAVASDTSVVDLTRDCDSVMFTLSKGLGAPAGSMLLGTADLIKEARIWRKRMGGGMRQVGILAAAGLIALEDGPKRLHEDHDNGRRLAHGLAEIGGVDIDLDSVQTNIVVFDISGTGITSPQLCGRLKEKNVLAVGIDDQTMRMVTHLDITAEDIESVLGSIRELV
jgi:threonine aldolase